jgi:hypothetical protein
VVDADGRRRRRADAFFAFCERSFSDDAFVRGVLAYLAQLPLSDHTFDRVFSDGANVAGRAAAGPAVRVRGACGFAVLREPGPALRVRTDVSAVAIGAGDCRAAAFVPGSSVRLRCEAVDRVCLLPLAALHSGGPSFGACVHVLLATVQLAVALADTCGRARLASHFAALVFPVLAEKADSAAAAVCRPYVLRIALEALPITADHLPPAFPPSAAVVGRVLNVLLQNARATPAWRFAPAPPAVTSLVISEDALARAAALRAFADGLVMQESLADTALAYALSCAPVAPVAIVLPKFLLHFAPIVRGKSDTGQSEFEIALPFASAAAVAFAPWSRGRFAVVYADSDAVEEVAPPSCIVAALPARLIASEDAQFEFVAYATALRSDARAALLGRSLGEFVNVLEVLEKRWTRAHDEAVLELRQFASADRTLSFATIGNGLLKDVDRRIIALRLDLIADASARPLEFLERLAQPIVVDGSSALALLDRFKRNAKKHGKVSVTFNRSKAVRALSAPGDSRGRLLLDQLMAQLPASRLPRLRQRESPWRVDLAGEGASDAGGPGRDLFSGICEEVMGEAHQLFVWFDGKRAPNPRADPDKLVYVGALIGAALFSKLPQPFDLAPFVWAYLTSGQVLPDGIDSQYFSYLNVIAGIDREEIYERLDLVWTVESVLGENVELFDGGRDLRVSYLDRIEYCELCRDFRRREFQPGLSALASGLEYIIPAKIRGFFTASHLESLSCGLPDVPLADLMANCVIAAGDPTHVPLIAMLWQALERFTREERIAFVRFATGRSSLPAHGQSWTSPLTVQFDQYTRVEVADSRLPIAQTCSSTIIIPPYSSVEAMEAKLRTAITFGSDIERDRPLDSAEVVDLA